MTEIQLTSEITVRLIDKAGGDHSAVAAARVSTKGEDCLQFLDPARAGECYGLISYMMKHRHGSVFEHSSLTFFVHAPIFVFREWHRHRIGHCLAGDSVIDFVDINGTRAPRICRTIQQLHDRWEDGEVNGQATDQERLSYAMELVGRGVSVRSASIKTGIAEGTITRHRKGVVRPDRRGSRWRVEGMRVRVLDENSQFFTHGHIRDVVESGVKELVGLKTERGHLLRCSRDHRILTDDGWYSAGDLRKGDRVAVIGKRSMFPERQIPPSLRRGIGVWTSAQRQRLIKDEDNCYVCGRLFVRAALELDHVVPVVVDLVRSLDLENLKPICGDCHKIKSAGEQSLAMRGCVSGSRFVRLSETPTVCAEEMTYDISMQGPHHNFVANGIVVHNSYNEASGRYSQLESVFWIPRRDRKMVPAPEHKSARPKFVEAPPELYAMVVARLSASYRVAYNNYEEMIAAGVAKEVARACLPVGIYSSCWVTVNPRSLMAFLSLRTHEPEAKYVSYPQAEIEEAARVVETIFAEGWPLTCRAFNENGRVGP